MKKKEIVSLLSEFSYQHVLEAMEILTNQIYLARGNQLHTTYFH